MIRLLLDIKVYYVYHGRRNLNERKMTSYTIELVASQTASAMSRRFMQASCHIFNPPLS